MVDTEAKSVLGRANVVIKTKKTSMSSNGRWMTPWIMPWPRYRTSLSILPSRILLYR